MSTNEDLFLNKREGVVVRERRGPHWRQDGRLYFVTWRQADSLPREVRDQIQAEREQWLLRHGNLPLNELPKGTQEAYWRLFNRKTQERLDAGYGSCVLRNAEVLKVMTKALHHFHGTRYDLGSFAIAANHVHVIVAPKPGIDLSEVQHSWKSFTANKINELFDRTGPLWRSESYDRIVRDARELSRITAYILRHAEQGHYVEHHVI